MVAITLKAVRNRETLKSTQEKKKKLIERWKEDEFWIYQPQRTMSLLCPFCSGEKKH